MELSGTYIEVFCVETVTKLSKYYTGIVEATPYSLYVTIILVEV